MTICLMAAKLSEGTICLDLEIFQKSLPRTDDTTYMNIIGNPRDSINN